MAEQIATQLSAVAIQEPAQAPPKPRHSNLYVSGLGTALNSEDELRQLFQQYGTVESCRVVGRSNTARDVKSFAFVKFATVEQSLDAITALHGRQYGDASLEVKTADADAGDRNPELLAPPSDNLYAKNLPKGLSVGELRELFAPYGSVVECRVLHSGTARTDNGTGAGALVRMGSVEEAAAAIAGLHNRRRSAGTLPLVVRYADSQEHKAKKAARLQKRGALMLLEQQHQQPPSPVSHHHGGGGGGGHYPQPPPQAYGRYPQQPPRLQHAPPPPVYAGGAPAGPYDSHSSYGSHHSSQNHGGTPPGYYSPMQPSSSAGHMGPGAGACSLYVKNLPEQTDRLWLYEKFAPFGGVLSVRVLTNNDGTCRGVGFINYADPESAHRAVQAMNGLPMGERRLFVAPQTHRQPRT